MSESSAKLFVWLKYISEVADQEWSKDTHQILNVGSGGQEWHRPMVRRVEECEIVDQNFYLASRILTKRCNVVRDRRTSLRAHSKE